jgi:hypothetical protein
MQLLYDIIYLVVNTRDQLCDFLDNGA